MVRYGETADQLYRAVAVAGDGINEFTIEDWLLGINCPRWWKGWNVVRQIEERYGLPSGYFRSKALPRIPSAREEAIRSGKDNLTRHLLRHHLPDDFDGRTRQQQLDILQWFYATIMPGQTKYGQYLRQAVSTRYGLHFPGIETRCFGSNIKRQATEVAAHDKTTKTNPRRSAPPGLVEEMKELLHFQTAPLSAPNFPRHHRWSEGTIRLRVQQLSLLFGALSAAPDSEFAGLGIPPASLTFGLLVFPSIWDWYLNWSERRRGFFSTSDRSQIHGAMALLRWEKGWIRQHPELGRRLGPIKSVLSRKDISGARGGWKDACEFAARFLHERQKDIRRLLRKHRDPYEAIVPVLEADRPLAEYRKISDEIIASVPNERQFAIEAARAIRAYLILRLCMHTGLRQRNLRELRLCPRGNRPRTDFELEHLRCGELRWRDRDRAWEIYIPEIAFKNAGSSFFSNQPYRLLLPDLSALYHYLDAYIERHRPILLGGFSDPGTFFVRTVKNSEAVGIYNDSAFYLLYKYIVQRYGIFNPYTGRGAIKGILPHGPHCVRDVLATHILKETGSFEQAGYAIQDTEKTVRQHYARFLPQDKIAQAAEILNKVWN